ncbi:MAG: amidohydrolase [Chloroflexi bacterium]|nr:amidohydrolase [Chloroflexota bacterium]
MIIDVHTHPPRSREGKPDTAEAPPWRPDKAVSLPSTWAEYEQQELSVVDYALAFSIATYPATPDDLKGQYDIFGPAVEVNNAVAEFAREHDGRVIGFGSVHPDDPNALNEIERCQRELGLRGLKLGLNYQRGKLLGANAFAVYRKAEQLGLPILFHMGTSPVQFAPLEEAYPLYVDRIAIAFPKLKIVMAHIGHPWQIDTIVVIRKHPNVYADISAQFFRPWSMYNALRLATEWSVLPKLLFGSDYPIALPQETIDGTRRVNEILEGTKLPRVPEDEIEKIIHRDALGLLGLDR